MRSALPVLLLLAGCPKAGAPEVPLAGTAIVSTVMAPMRGDVSTEIPPRVKRAVTKELKAHGLVAEFQPTAGIETARSTEKRLELAQAAAGDADLIVLLEAEPRFATQMAGRFAWDVEVDVTLAHPGGDDGPRTWTWDIPVHLIYHHQREAEAFDEAAIMIQRKLDHALDEYVGPEGS